MKIFVPTWYCPDVTKINLEILKEKGIKVMLFDLDNTIVGAYEDKVTSKVEALLKKASQYFTVYVISNNHPPRVSRVANSINAGYLADSRKPSVKRIKEFLLTKDALNESTVLVGDQLLTDIWCANRLNIKSILVEPFEKRDLLITKFNRFIDKRIRTHHQRRGKLKDL